MIHPITGALLTKFLQKGTSKTEWKSFEFYSESSSECNQCELQAVLRPV